MQRTAQQNQKQKQNQTAHKASDQCIVRLTLQLFAKKIGHGLEACRRGQLELCQLQLRRIAGRFEEYNHYTQRLRCKRISLRFLVH